LTSLRNFPEDARLGHAYNIIRRRLWNCGTMAVLTSYLVHLFLLIKKSCVR
jgi:hypothetical protein